MIRALATLKKLNEDIPVLNEDLQNLETRNQLTESASVNVGVHAYVGTTVVIGANRLEVKNRTEKGKFILKDRKVVFEIE